MARSLAPECEPSTARRSSRPALRTSGGPPSDPLCIGMNLPELTPQRAAEDDHRSGARPPRHIQLQQVPPLPLRSSWPRTGCRGCGGERLRSVSGSGRQRGAKHRDRAARQETMPAQLSSDTAHKVDSAGSRRQAPGCQALRLGGDLVSRARPNNAWSPGHRSGSLLASALGRDGPHPLSVCESSEKWAKARNGAVAAARQPRRAAASERGRPSSRSVSSLAPAERKPPTRAARAQEPRAQDFSAELRSGCSASGRAWRRCITMRL